MLLLLDEVEECSPDHYEGEQEEDAYGDGEVRHQRSTDSAKKEKTKPVRSAAPKTRSSIVEYLVL